MHQRLYRVATELLGVALIESRQLLLLLLSLRREVGAGEYITLLSPNELDSLGLYDTDGNILAHSTASGLKR